MTKEKIKVAVIGGSGLYTVTGGEKSREIVVKTPFGAPSAPILVGSVGGTACAFLPRHGKGHVFLPSELNNRANIYALKSLGVEYILSFAAVGSLKEELVPEHFVFPDQLIDETKGRVSTFFGHGVVGHVAFDAPFCMDQSGLLFEAAKGLGITSHKNGTYLCMEGPLYSTRAESELHRQMGCSVIGMTAATEAKLAREAEICYSSVCMVTDYDCWKKGEEVSTASVLAHLNTNVVNAQKLIQKAVPLIARRSRSCKCGHALDGAVFTVPKLRPAKTARALKLLLGDR